MRAGPPFDISGAAREIEDTRRSAGLVEPLTTRFGPIDLATAYDVAARASQLRRTDTGARTVGRKIGFTNRTIWDRYGVHQPIWGWMYDDSVVLAEAGALATIDLARLVQPRVEPEIVVCLRDRVVGGMAVTEIAEALEWVAFGYEVVHCHYPGWRFQPADTVIDAALHAASRVGERAAPWPTMVTDLARFSLRLARHDEIIDQGLGANVLDSPLHALQHLAGVLGPDGISPGEVVTTGTLTDAAVAAPGDVYSVEFEGLPLAPLTLSCA